MKTSTAREVYIGTPESQIIMQDDIDVDQDQVAPDVRENNVIMDDGIEDHEPSASRRRLAMTPEPMTGVVREHGSPDTP